MGAEHTCNPGSETCKYPQNPHALPAWVRDALVGLCTTAVVGMTVAVLRLQGAMITYTTRFDIVSGQISSIGAKVQQDSDFTRSNLALLREDMTRNATGSYTVREAYISQQEQVAELKKLWDAIHSIQLDVARLQNQAPAQNQRAVN